MVDRVDLQMQAASQATMRRCLPPTNAAGSQAAAAAAESAAESHHRVAAAHDWELERVHLQISSLAATEPEPEPPTAAPVRGYRLLAHSSAVTSAMG